MARNWTIADAIKAIAEQNMDDVKDIYRRFPTFAMMATRAVGGDNEAACNIIASLPEWATVGKFEKAMKNDSETTEEPTSDGQEAVAEVEEPKEKPVKKTEKKTKAETNANSEYANMSGREMWDMLKNAGKLKDMKAKSFGTKKADMLAYLEQYGLGDSETVDEDFEEVVPEAETDEYADKTPMDLFKECKKLGIKAAPKKSKEYYIDLIKKANETADDDDWADDEPVEEEPKPKKAKAEKKPAKKAKSEPKKVEEDDEDEDWDI